MNKSKIKVVVKEPYEKAKVVEIESNLKSLQNIVGGHIECFTLPNLDDNVAGYCNDEGLLIGLEPNIYRPEWKDAVVGSIVFVNTNENGEDISLTDEQIKDIIDYVDKNSVRDFGEFFYHVNTQFRYYDQREDEMEM